MRGQGDPLPRGARAPEELSHAYSSHPFGGAGTRLWPLSRELYPKQFLPLVGERTMIQETALRAASLPDIAAPIVVCNEAHRFLVAEQLRELGIAPQAILLEPVGRNTAPAVAIAALAALAGKARSKDARRRSGAARAAGGPRAHRRRKPCARSGDGFAGGPRGPPGHFRHRADPCGDRLRLHPPGRGAGGGTRRSPSSSRSRTPTRAESLRRKRRLFLEQRHVPAAGPRLPG